MGATYAKKLSNDQMKLIYTLGNKLGLVDKGLGHDDDLHNMVKAMTKKSSISGISMDEATKVIDRLKKEDKPKDKFRSGVDIKTDRDGFASEPQIRKIRALMFEIRRFDVEDFRATLDKRLRGILKKYEKTEDLRFLESSEAWKAIETLKGILASAEQKAEKFNNSQPNCQRQV